MVCVGLTLLRESNAVVVRTNRFVLDLSILYLGSLVTVLTFPILLNHSSSRQEATTRLPMSAEFAHSAALTTRTVSSSPVRTSSTHNVASMWFVTH
jgi:hypothetical protein